MTDPAPNTDLLLEVRHIIADEAHMNLQLQPGSIDAWNQSDWRCGSGMCFAGWALDRTDHTWVTKNPNTTGNSYVFAKPGVDYGTEVYDGILAAVRLGLRVTDDDRYEPERDYYRQHIADDADNDWFVAAMMSKMQELIPEYLAVQLPPMVFVRDAAKVVLGLNEDEAEKLFAGGNSLDDLDTHIADIKDGLYRHPGAAE